MPDRTRIIAIADDRDPLVDGALGLIEEMFAPQDRHNLSELRSELAERRLGMFTTYNFHMVAAVEEEPAAPPSAGDGPDGTDGTGEAEDDGADVRVGKDDSEDDDGGGGGGPRPAGVACGVYLGGVNAGFVMYLAVRRECRGRRIARLLRPALIEAFRSDARAGGHADLAWVLGEVRMKSPWLRRLVRTRGAVPFDLRYFHPGMSPATSEPYALYRQPLADRRRELPVVEVRRILYAIYRRAYRVRYPLQRESFVAMIEQLEGRETVGVHPDFAALLGEG